MQTYNNLCNRFLKIFVMQQLHIQQIFSNKFIQMVIYSFRKNWPRHCKVEMPQARRSLPILTFNFNNSCSEKLGISLIFFAVSTLWVSVNIVMPTLQNNFPNKSGHHFFIGNTFKYLTHLQHTHQAPPLSLSDSRAYWYRYELNLWIKIWFISINLSE